MANWVFEERDPRYVEQEVSQRDQFNNDEVKLAEAIVREVIQNSTDASAGIDPVKVKFLLREVASADATAFRNLFSTLRPHLKQCDIDDSLIDSKPPRVLLIEDFNTRGLTGAIDSDDGGNFYSFWRRHGRSGKGGRAGGRWGLGKLVYSSSSEVRCFFGLTVTAENSIVRLMGQAVLSNHEIENRRYVAHGFWFSDRSTNQMQLPISDPATVQEFVRMTGISRSQQSGLSLAIPFIDPSITDEVLITGVLSNYYFPILAEKLIVEVGSTLIDANTFPEVAKKHLKTPGHAEHFAFVTSVSAQLDKTPSYVAKIPSGNPPFKSLFADEEIASLKLAYGRGELLHVRLPVRLKRKSGEESESHADIFLKSPPENAKPFVLFARGSITVPGEQRYFNSAHAFGAFVGMEQDITAFLGDAENPAHTSWNGNAEKLNARWKSPGPVLRYLRNALWGLYDLVSEQAARKDPDALIDFFALADPSGGPGPKKRDIKGPPPDIKPGEKAFRIVKKGPGGFAIVPGPGAGKWIYPKAVRVRVAYDIVGGNPFSKHSPFDFDLTGNGITVDHENMKVQTPKPNVLALTVTAPDFRLEASGFDLNRDLVIDAKART